MELPHLRAILAIRELASLARAGEKLHLSPSAVFCQIRQLEDQVGQKLYERFGRQLRLTVAGEMLAQHAARILGAHDDALAALKERGSGKRSLLRIGCGPHSSLRIVPHLLRAFLAAHPRAEVRLATGDDPGLLHDVRAGLLDAVLMSMPVNDPEIDEVPLWNYEMVFALPPARNGDRPRPRLSDVRGSPFILYRRPIVVDEAFRLLCHDLRFEPDVVMENDEPDSIKELVKLGLGVTFLPMWSVGDDAARGALRILRPPKRQFYDYGLLQRKTGYRPEVLDDLLGVCRRWRDWWPLAPYVRPVAGRTRPRRAGAGEGAPSPRSGSR